MTSEFVYEFKRRVVIEINDYIRSYGRETDHIPNIPDDVLKRYVDTAFDDVCNIGYSQTENIDIDIEDAAATLTKSLLWHYRDYVCDATYYKITGRIYQCCIEFIMFMINKLDEEVD